MDHVFALYRKFDELGLNIKEAFTVDDAVVAQNLLNSVMRKHIRVAEIGAWKGCSTAVLADAVHPYHGRIVSIDTFKGSTNTWNLNEAAENRLEAICRHNMEQLGFSDTVVTVVSSSLQAAELFPDNYFDFVFVDGDHRYAPFIADIRAWLAKVAVGGILCGHDHTSPTKYKDHDVPTQKLFDDSPDVDFLTGKGHPGVIKGLHDIFHDDYMIALDKTRSSLWWHHKRASSYDWFKQEVGPPARDAAEQGHGANPGPGASSAVFEVEALRAVLDAVCKSTSRRGLDRKRFQELVTEEGQRTPNEGPAAVKHSMLLSEARKILGAYSQ